MAHHLNLHSEKSDQAPWTNDFAMYVTDYVQYFTNNFAKANRKNNFVSTVFSQKQ